MSRPYRYEAAAQSLSGRARTQVQAARHPSRCPLPDTPGLLGGCSAGLPLSGADQVLGRTAQSESIQVKLVLRLCGWLEPEPRPVLVGG